MGRHLLCRTGAVHGALVLQGVSEGTFDPPGPNSKRIPVLSVFYVSELLFPAQMLSKCFLRF